MTLNLKLIYTFAAISFTAVVIIVYRSNKSSILFNNLFIRSSIYAGSNGRNNCMYVKTIGKENRSIKSEVRPVTVPNLIIQYGLPRTSTTLQFHILCLMMTLLHEHDVNNVGCWFRRAKEDKKYVVLKRHRISQLLGTLPSDSWIFVTSSDDLSRQQKRELTSSIQKIKARNITIPYIADINEVSKRRHLIVYDYQPIFKLSDDKMQLIAEYLRYWVLLRLCCGRQMSADWRNHMAPNASYKQHRDRHSLSYTACEMYNITKVESLLLNTYIFKKFGHITSLSDVIGRTSDVDGKLDGNYCERCNSNISKRHLRFNQKCA